MRKSETNDSSVDVIIVGAGFAGMYMLYYLRKKGLKARILEAGDDVGGTWYWNRYPGARCDVESMAYSYSFDEELQQEWNWSNRFSYQPEILDYLKTVADRFELNRDIFLKSRVLSAEYEEDVNIWRVRTDTGVEYSAKFCVMATGCLSVPKNPKIDGLERFEGETFYTWNWPKEKVDLAGKRVGVIGTGSSGVQCIPVIATDASHLSVFQRTPNFIVPAFNRALEKYEADTVKKTYKQLREKARNSIAGDFPDEGTITLGELPINLQRQHLEESWKKGGFNMQYPFTDLLTDAKVNETVGEFVREKIRSIVNDPKTAETLSPRNHPFGTKRMCVEDNYYQTFNRKNVSLIDLSTSPIEEIVSLGVKTTTELHRLDTLVLATGFDAMTGALTAVDIRGRGGVALRDKWKNGARTFLGMTIAEFPNLFTVTGPGSPSVLCNMVSAIEQSVEWIGDCIKYVEEKGYGGIEARRSAENKWTAHVSDAANQTLYPLANSWYVGANISDKARGFMPYVNGLKVYEEACQREADADYQNFTLTRKIQ